MGGLLIDGCGAEDKYTVLKDLGSFLCPNCHKKSIFEIKLVERKVKVFFVPVTNASVKYAIFCQNCKRGSFVSEQDKNDLMNGSKQVNINDSGIFVEKKNNKNPKISSAPKIEKRPTKSESLDDELFDSNTTCPKCKSQLQKNASFCCACGYKLKKEDKSHCGSDYIEAGEADIPDDAFSFVVKDVLTISNRGTVATGMVKCGTVHVGDTVEIVGLQNEKKTAVVDGIEKYRGLLQVANEGDEIGLLLRGVSRCEIKCGQTIRKNGSSQWRETPDKKKMKTADDALLTNSSDNFFNEEAQLTEPLTPANTKALDSSFNNKRSAFSSPINLLPERKVCPKCNLLYVGTKEKCSICGCDLVEKKDG